MSTLKLSPDILALNPELSPREQKLVRLDGDNYRSELERRFAREWITPQEMAGDIARWRYEPITFKLPGGNYTPDFMIEWSDGRRITFAETKGWTKSLRADHRAFEEAANTHTWARFVWVTWDTHSGWAERWAK